MNPQELVAEHDCPAKLRAEIDTLKAQLRAIEEREAAVCPEDVGFDEYIRVLEKRTKERDALKADNDALRAFAQKMCAGYLGVGEEIGDIDGATIQEWAAEIGLLKATPVSEPCGEGCVCAEVYTPGESWECYRPTPLLQGKG